MNILISLLFAKANYIHMLVNICCLQLYVVMVLLCLVSIIVMVYFPCISLLVGELRMKLLWKMRTGLSDLKITCSVGVANGSVQGSTSWLHNYSIYY